MYGRRLKSVILLHFAFGFVLSFALINAKSLQLDKSAAKSGEDENGSSNSNLVDGTLDDYSLITEMKALRRQLRHCFKVEHSVWECLKSKSLEIFERVMNADVIPLYEGVRLVRKRLDESKNEGRAFDANVLLKNERRDFKYHNWFDKLAMSLENALKTHNLQINLAQATSAYMRVADRQDNVNGTREDGVGSARARRHRYNMIITMMFGVTALGALVVPIGFQLLSIVSGKALLLAKMALLLASINGLKRVANSGLHYGLYHVPGEHYGGYYDRGDLNHPRNVPIPVAAISQPLDMGLK